VAPGLVDTSAVEHDLQVEARLDGEAVTVTLGWTGSWRNAQNWDAAWVFLKARRGDGPWQPLRLTPGRSSVQAVDAGPPPTVDVPDDGMGAFLYRSAAGSTGRNDWAVQLIPQSLPGGGGPLDVQAFGLEMVYVPAGSFYVGDGASDFRFRGKDAPGPFHVAAEGNVVTIASVSGEREADSLLRTSGLYVDGDDGINPEGARPEPLNAAFPTGYGAFYVMKYELTQGEYARFLNTLLPEQAQSRDLSRAERYDRYRGSLARSGDAFQAAHPERACNFIGETDLRAFADWAGLRPMTELEFEKAARGDRPPVPGEFAWGTTSIQKATRIVNPDGTTAESEDGDELVASGNASFETIGYVSGDGGPGPLRVGIFAASSDGGREASGASYYGLRAMSGHLKEPVVSLSQEAGPYFRGTHGDGRLTDAGMSNVDGWPPERILGSRGGNFGFAAKYLRVSDRTAAGAPADRLFSRGMRVARTAPRSTPATD
jgi:formylglycine-generating enzyme required for sulfatase activity